MTEFEFKFHTEEYKELRKEVLDKIAKAETLIQYAVLMASAVFSWLATQESIVQNLPTKTIAALHPLARIAWWIPFVGTMLIGMIGFAQYIRIKEMGEYMSNLESALGHPDLGWEKFLSKKKYTVSPVFALTWLALFFGTGFIALFVH